MYEDAQKSNRETPDSSQRQEHVNNKNRPRLIKEGPSTEVSWCFPILPGILIANSSYIISPLWGESGVIIVFYYGFGAKEIVSLWEWIS